MFSNLTREMICYSVLPTVAVSLIGIILFFVARNKEFKGFKVNYIVKITLMLANSFVLPLICGYTIWVIESFWVRDLFFSNIPYIALIIFLSLSLLVLIIWIYLKLLKSIKNDYVKKVTKEEQ